MFKKSFLAMALVVALFASPALATKAEPFTIGIVDMNVIMQKSMAAQSIRDQVEKKRKEYQTGISKQEDSLRTAEQELVKQKDKLSVEEFARKRGEFQQKIISAERQLQESKRQLDIALAHSMVDLRQQTTRIIADVSREKDLDVVLTQEAVILAEKSFDITDIVLERMNKQLKKIDIKWSDKK